MPYIDQPSREWYEPQLKQLALLLRRDQPGHLNYLLTRLIVAWLPIRPCYADYNTVLGVLEAAKLELYRRMVADYEDSKCEENGDVY